MSALKGIAILLLCSLVAGKLEPDQKKKDNSIVISTTSGQVQGKVTTTAAGKAVYTYLGIPYAKPPLGPLRHKHPKPAEPWDGIRNATEYGAGCMQFFISIVKYVEGAKNFQHTGPVSEDCLFLNIFVPEPRPNDSSVYVFLHPGGFTEGSSSVPLMQMEEFSSRGDVITVTLNYRLGSFGMLYLDHPEVEGNAALMDQVMALKWVKDNIKAFGGDPEKVTLGGLSAGAISTGLHMLSPQSEGLFNRVIAESGSAIFDLGVVSKKSMKEVSLQVAENLGCSNLDDVNKVYKCLQDADAEALKDSQPRNGDNYIVFFPIVDGKFLARDPQEAFLKGEFPKMDLLTGFNSDEGTLFLTILNPLIFNPTRNSVQPTEEDAHKIMRYVNHNATEVEIKHLLEIFSDKNLKEGSAERILQEVKDAVSSYLFNCAIGKKANLVAERGSKVYAYYLDHLSKGFKTAKWLGVHHAASAYYSLGNVFKSRFSNEVADEDKKLSERMIQYWSNFIRTGDPNISHEPKEEKWITWPAFTPSEHNYLVLAPDNSTVLTDVKQENCPDIDNFFNSPKD